MWLPRTKLIWTHPNSLVTTIRLAHSVSPEISSLARVEIRCCRLICRDTVTVRTQRRPQGSSRFVFCLCLVAASFDKREAVGRVEWSCSTDKWPGPLYISYAGIQLDLQDQTVLDSLLCFTIWKGVPLSSISNIKMFICIWFWPSALNNKSDLTVTQISVCLTWMSLHLHYLLHLWFWTGTTFVTGQLLPLARGGRWLLVQCSNTTPTQGLWRCHNNN